MEYQLELRHYRYFMAVAEELHFRRAAERLHISQPGLSRQIAQMEERLGVALFERDQRNVRLSPAGEFLRREVVQLEKQLRLMQQGLKMVQAGEQGEIQIGFVGSAMQSVIPNMLAQLHQDYPLIRTSLEEMAIGEQVAAIEEERLDVGFVRLESTPPGMMMQTVQEDTFSLVVPKAYPLDQDSFQSLAQLKDEAFILFSANYSPIYYDKIISICEDHGFWPKISHKSVHAQTIFRLVEKQLGVAIVPTSLQFGFDLDIKFIELKNIRQKALLSILWKKQHRNPSLDRLIALFQGSSV